MPTQIQPTPRNIAIWDAIRIISNLTQQGWFLTGTAQPKMINAIHYLRSQIEK